MKKLFLPIAAVALFLTACLQIEPDINHDRLALGIVTGSTTVTPGEDATITAVVTERDRPIISVAIEWRKNNAPQENISMEAGENNIWTGVIPGQEEGFTVTWNILVIKANGDREQSTQRQITWTSIISAWNFPDLVGPNEDNIWPATSGTNTVGTNLQFFYAGNGPQATLGRTIGHADGDRRALNVPNRAVTADGWIPGERPANDVEVHATAENSAGWIITLNATGYENITFSAEQSSSNNGPRAFRLAYRIGTTGAWTVFGETGIVTAMGDMPGGDMASTFTNVPLPATVNNQAEVQVRVWIANNTQRSDGRFRLNNDGGNTSINNIVFAVGSGDVPPPPPPPTYLEVTGVGHLPTAPTQDDPVTVSATVTAPEGATIASVYLEWTRNSTDQSAIEMTATADVFSATIPEQNIGDVITYRVVATNDLGEVTESDWSNFTVIDGTEPIGGTFGALTWGVANNILTISVTAATGNAEMLDFASAENLTTAPWAAHAALFTSVVIEDRVTSIGVNAFRGLTNVTAVTIGSNVISIGDSAFHSSGLTSVNIPNSVIVIHNSAFRYCAALTSVTLGTGVDTIWNHAFREASLTGTVVLPNNMSFLGNQVFRDNSSITSITFGESLTSIGADAIRGTSITSAILPNTLISIGADAFRETNLVSVVIPNSVTTIEADAFRQITTLLSITFGTGITSLPADVVRQSSNLTTITSLNPVPPTTVGNTFRDIPTGTINLYVPATAIGDYTTAPGWSVFAPRIYATTP
ncbi:MAG: leucine-rich repeat domain-containing protein [Bacteroidales bacterium]|nr:leucine-rich repeat domain-containing protein [Bacteroidales bacterium]